MLQRLHLLVTHGGWQVFVATSAFHRASATGPAFVRLHGSLGTSHSINLQAAELSLHSGMVIHRSRLAAHPYAVWQQALHLCAHDRQAGCCAGMEQGSSLLTHG